MWHDICSVLKVYPCATTTLPMSGGFGVRCAVVLASTVRARGLNGRAEDGKSKTMLWCISRWSHACGWPDKLCRSAGPGALRICGRGTGRSHPTLSSIPILLSVSILPPILSSPSRLVSIPPPVVMGPRRLLAWSKTHPTPRAPPPDVSLPAAVSGVQRLSRLHYACSLPASARLLGETRA